MLNFVNNIDVHYVLKNIDGELAIFKELELYCQTVHSKSLKQMFEIYFNYFNIVDVNIGCSATISGWADKLGMSSEELKIKIRDLYDSTILNSPEKLI